MQKQYYLFIAILYIKKHMTFEKVSQIVNLDRRTVKKYIEEGTNVSI